MRSPLKFETSPASGNGSLANLSKAQMDAVVEAQARMLAQIEELNRAWLTSMREAADSSMEFAGQLTRCSDPTEAARVCNEWLVSRTNAFMGDTQRMGEIWLSLCGAPLQAAKAETSALQSSPSETEKVAARASAA